MLTFCSVKYDENSELEDAVKAFLRKGGKIDIVPPGVGKDTNKPFNKGADNQKQAEIQEGFARDKKLALNIKKEICDAERKAKQAKKGKVKMPTIRPENRGRSGRMNIHKLQNGKCIVTIQSRHIGTFNDETAAINARDEERERIGLPKAAY